MKISQRLITGFVGISLLIVLAAAALESGYRQAADLSGERTVRVAETGKKRAAGLEKSMDKAIKDRESRLAARQGGSAPSWGVWTVFCLAVLLLAAGLGGLISLSITRPLLELRDAVAALGKGDRGGRVSIRSQDEVGLLASAFNKMADDLRGTIQKEKDLLTAVTAGAAEKKWAEERRALDLQITVREQQLKELAEQRQAKEQQLKAADHQRQVNEQIFNAADERRLANEQLLKSAEQQMKTFERQLKAAHEQLLEKKEELLEKEQKAEMMNKVMTDREVRVIELKKEVNRLTRELGRPEPYAGGRA